MNLELIVFMHDWNFFPIHTLSVICHIHCNFCTTYLYDRRVHRSAFILSYSLHIHIMRPETSVLYIWHQRSLYCLPPYCTTSIHIPYGLHSFITAPVLQHTTIVPPIPYGHHLRPTSRPPATYPTVWLRFLTMWPFFAIIQSLLSYQVYCTEVTIRSYDKSPAPSIAISKIWWKY